MRFTPLYRSSFGRLPEQEGEGSLRCRLLSRRTAPAMHFTPLHKGRGEPRQRRGGGALFLESAPLQPQSHCLLQTKHDVHVLHGLSYGAF